MKKILHTLIFCLPLAGGAQDAATDTARRLVSLHEVVISANRVEESKSQVAQQVEVISARDMAISNPATSADMVMQTGEVLVQKSQLGGGSPILRGFEAVRVLLVVDGVRQNNILFRAGHLQNIITFDPAMLARAEVLFGPSSVAYGSDALGGVIHLFSKNPRLSTTGGLNVSGNYALRFASAASEKHGHFDVNVGGGRLASLTSFTFTDFDDLVQGKKLNRIADSIWLRPFYVETFNGKDSLMKNDNIYRQVFSGYSQYDILQKFLFKQSDRLQHVVNLQLSNSSDVPRYDRLTDPQGSGLRNAVWYYGPQYRLLAAYEAHISGNGFFNSYRAGLNYQDYQESRHQRRFGKEFEQHRVEDVQIFGAQVHARRLTDRNDLRIGLEGYFNDLVSTAEQTSIITGETKPLDTRYPDGDNIMWHVGIYATNTYRISDVLSLNSGLRLEHIRLHSTFVTKDFFPFPFDEVNQSHLPLTGSLGLIWNRPDGWQLRTVLSSGFRAPNVDDLAKVFESVPGSLVVPNPDLKPERTYNGELAVSKTVGEMLQAEVTGFYTLFRDAIVLAPFTFNGEDSIEYNGELSAVLAAQNTGKAFINGGSGKLLLDLPAGFSVLATATYTRGRIVEADSTRPLDHIPPVYGKFSVIYNWKQLRAEAYLLFNGAKKLEDYGGGEDNLNYAVPDYGMPAWQTVNLRLQYSINQYVTLQAACENLLDVNYRVFASGISGPGRNFIVALRGSF
ncbi:MAG: TonB-dependent receptor [Chitinophagales bacterium]|nr:TonB-dependent receptor [Chitinophagales bacterium]MDW8393074.1 TonB-dependent receptor [Chitinophagales bacterium]